MKILLATTMALGVVFMLGANQPTEATVIPAVEPILHQDHVIPVWYRGHSWNSWHHRHHHYQRHQRHWGW